MTTDSDKYIPDKKNTYQIHSKYKLTHSTMSGRPPTRTFSTRSVSRPGTPGGRSINSSFVDNDYYTDYVTVSAEYNELIAVYKETLDELHISQEETARYQVENDKLGTKNVQLKNVVNLHQSRTSELETRLLSSESKSSSKDRNTLNIISKCNGLEKKYCYLRPRQL